LNDHSTFTQTGMSTFVTEMVLLLTQLSKVLARLNVQENPTMQVATFHCSSYEDVTQSRSKQTQSTYG